MEIAIDIGGTKTLIALFEDGAKTQETKFPTPDTFDEWCQIAITTIGGWKSDRPVNVISLAAPGLINRADGEVISLGNLGWHHAPLRQRLAEEFGCSVLVENDANLAGLAEANSLGPEAYPLVLYVTISTGIGTGVISHGKILPELADSEGGQMLFVREGRLQRWETFASGRAIREKYGKFAAEIQDPAIWAEIARTLAPGFGNMVSLLQPDAVIVGGSIGTYFERYQEFLLEDLTELERDNPVIRGIPPFFKAQHPEEAVIYGAHLLAQRHTDS